MGREKQPAPALDARGEASYFARTFSPGEQEPGEVAPADRPRKGDGRAES